MSRSDAPTEPRGEPAPDSLGVPLSAFLETRDERRARSWNLDHTPPAGTITIQLTPASVILTTTGRGVRPAL